ncbi:MAG: glycosyltransferase family 4 protein, partial [Actinomycetota bacterium]|nr:glycosyltransferase family 4 protein [Actinomycetota bacterium]
MPGAARRRVLVVTNDFPPRLGGIQSFVHALVAALPPAEVVVYASAHAGAPAFDAAQPFPVIRHPTGLLLPTASARRRITAVLTEYRARAVWFGAAAPLGLLAGSLRTAGAQRLVATTHGHEAGWSGLPVARTALRRIASQVDVMTFLGEYTRRRLAAAVGDRCPLTRLAPGVDTDRFRPGLDGEAVRARYGIAASAPTVVCVSRLVPRKGQDTLIDAWPEVRRAVPGARLLLVGRGPYERSLRARADRRGVGTEVVFAGGVDEQQLPAHVGAGDVFAMPCRTRRGGLDVEGLGLVYLEASACGRPVLAGASGGAPDAVLDGRTGFVVDGRRPGAVAERLIALLRDDRRRDRLG